MSPWTYSRPLSPWCRLQVLGGPLIGGSAAPTRLAALLLLWAGVAAAEPPPLATEVFTFSHQTAADAVTMVYPLLSVDGTVELRPASNTLVIRDRQAVLDRVVELLRRLDHPARRIEVQIQLVMAGTGRPGRSQLPADLTRRLRDLLRYESFDLLAEAGVRVDEGEEVAYDLGNEYRVSFRLGTLVENERLKLQGFRVRRQLENPGARDLIHTNLNLLLDQPTVLGLAQTESSEEALMVVLRCRLFEPTQE